MPGTNYLASAVIAFMAVHRRGLKQIFLEHKQQPSQLTMPAPRAAADVTPDVVDLLLVMGHVRYENSRDLVIASCCPLSSSK
eukprot:CAMPEP_0185786382 /NCGR_PEP_ID=MMETSP1174-20130828/135055_1 /TAXON_ID=35687 /ORGANISM="Dictyocha speculum, Strain CCMP1381" /LENGTH=81 /DNA_ID=CAMNT_0028478981 /DNA_START=201 /DNA_END=443 /DNA_ORIENTATION=+